MSNVRTYTILWKAPCIFLFIFLLQNQEKIIFKEKNIKCSSKRLISSAFLIIKWWRYRSFRFLPLNNIDLYFSFPFFYPKISYIYLPFNHWFGLSLIPEGKYSIQREISTENKRKKERNLKMDKKKCILRILKWFYQYFN